MSKKTDKGLTPIGDLLTTLVQRYKPPTPLQERLLSMPLPADDEDAAILYQHSVLCQTCMPYRDPGKEMRACQRSNGRVSLRIQAGNAYDSTRDT